jgi:hypothetical protein
MHAMFPYAVMVDKSNSCSVDSAWTYSLTPARFKHRTCTADLAPATRACMDPAQPPKLIQHVTRDTIHPSAKAAVAWARRAANITSPQPVMLLGGPARVRQGPPGQWAGSAKVNISTGFVQSSGVDPLYFR